MPSSRGGPVRLSRTPNPTRGGRESAEAAGSSWGTAGNVEGRADATLSRCLLPRSSSSPPRPLHVLSNKEMRGKKKRKPQTTKTLKAKEWFSEKRCASLHFYLWNASLRCRLVPGAHPCRCCGRTELGSAEGTAPLLHHSAALRKHPSSPAGRQLETAEQ